MGCVSCLTLCRMTDLQTRREPGWIPDVATFGARLALVRQAMGWGNVKQAAQLCGIAVETWRTWERDGVEPKSLVSACMKISGVTGVDYRWLALGPDVRQGDPVPVAAGGDTLRYLPHERIVAVGTGNSSGDLSNTCSNVRTRPIDGLRLDRGALR